jgi:hypothetical protein
MQLENQLQLETIKLKQFGLNPMDWSLEKIKKNTFKIKHKEDSSFILKGYFEDRSWKKIWLFSI